MKDEEMAEQFADNISGFELTCSLLSAKDKNHAYRLGRYDGFLAGLKAGRPQWHKAKEIIKKFTEFGNNEIEYDPEHPQEYTDKWNKLCKQAEQFLKEIKENGI